MSLFQRIKDVIVADFTGVVERQEKKDPIKMLNVYLQQCEKEVENVRRLVERQHQLKAEFTRELKQAENMVAKREHQASIAAQAGEADLQQFALLEKATYEERVAQLRETLYEVNQQLLVLEHNYEDMKHKLKDMSLRRLQLMGRENIARANAKMNKVTDGTNEYTSYGRFEEIDAYFERLEFQSDSSSHNQSLDGRIAQLEKQLKTVEKAPAARM